MNLVDRKGFTGPLLILVLLVTTAATLRFAQDFFLPLALAGLLSFLLSPLVRRLERWHLGRVGAVLVTATLAFVLIGGLTYLVASQVLDLAGSVPKYRSNLIARVSALKTHENNPLSRAFQTISEVTAALNKQEEMGALPAVAEKTRPVRVEVVQSADGSMHLLLGVLWPVIGPLADTAVVIVIVIFMLLAGEDLRDRLIHLLGRGRLRVTTQALDEAGHATQARRTDPRDQRRTQQSHRPRRDVRSRPEETRGRVPQIARGKTGLFDAGLILRRQYAVDITWRTRRRGPSSGNTLLTRRV